MKKSYLIVILIILFAIIGTVFIYRGCEKSDSIRFKEEYSKVSDNNPFTYRNLDEIVRIMEKGTGVVYLGFPECPWCQAYVKYLDDVAKEVGIEKIYYYNILDDRKNNTEGYQKIVEILKDYLQNDPEGNARIYVPNVSFHVNGKVIGNDYETSLDTHELSNPIDYWTDDEVKELKDNLKEYMQEVYIALNACTDCNK